MSSLVFRGRWMIMMCVCLIYSVQAQDFETACRLAQPFCSDASVELTFPNTIGDLNGLGEIGCLNTTPNPSWYFLRIAESGELVFDIRQWVDADGDSILDSGERQLDVDFIAWGPFETSYIVDCEAELAKGCDLNNDGENIRPAECVNNVDEPAFYLTNSDHTSIIDCSYARTSDANFIETLTIPEGMEGEYYIVLITNFADEMGVLQLEQTNLDAENAGTTDCSVLTPGIAPEQIPVCGAGEYPITVEGRFPTAVTFQWSRAAVGTTDFQDIPGATLPFYDQIMSDGVYRLRGFDASGVEVIDSPDEVTVLDVSVPSIAVSYSIAEPSFSGSYTVTASVTTSPDIIAAGFTDFEYRLDRSLSSSTGFVEYRPFQSSPIFEDVPPGDYQIVSRYVNCATNEGVSVPIMILGYPKYFTPNGDGFHDTWNLINTEDQPQVTLIYIFNRDGKLLKQLAPGSSGWDGTYNGSLMPSSQYWFRAEYNEQADRDAARSRKMFSGSFALVR